MLINSHIKRKGSGRSSPWYYYIDNKKHMRLCSLFARSIYRNIALITPPPKKKDASYLKKNNRRFNWRSLFWWKNVLISISLILWSPVGDIVKLEAPIFRVLLPTSLSFGFEIMCCRWHRSELKWIMKCSIEKKWLADNVTLISQFSPFTPAPPPPSHGGRAAGRDTACCRGKTTLINLLQYSIT